VDYSGRPDPLRARLVHLLPAPLAEEAMRPLVRRSASSEVAIGLGSQINESRGVAGQAGYARSAAASLVVKLDSGKVHVALTNRGIPIEEVNGRVVHALAHSQRGPWIRVAPPEHQRPGGANGSSRPISAAVTSPSFLASSILIG
jgi:hypothetical protein